MVGERGWCVRGSWAGSYGSAGASPSGGVGGGDALHGDHVSTEVECAPRFAQYREFLAELGRSVEHVIGNHDLAGAAPKGDGEAAEDPRAMARRELGIADDYRTFDVGDHRFVVLDSVELTGGEKVYWGFVGAEQLEWLRGVVEGSERDQVFRGGDARSVPDDISPT